MFPETFTLLQNEGYLMQGCLKASLNGILAGTNAQPGPLYAAFFNYAIEMERLLKILLLLDRWHLERQFLTNDELKAKGHTLQNLHQDVLSRPVPSDRRGITGLTQRASLKFKSQARQT